MLGSNGDADIENRAVDTDVWAGAGRTGRVGEGRENHGNIHTTICKTDSQ